MNIKNEVVKFQTDGGPVELTAQIVRDVISIGSNITDAEVFQFMQLCKYRNLNPFLGQAYIVKFKDKAQIITGKDVFTQRLKNNPACEGWNSGVIVWDKEKGIIEREGTFYLDSETLVGAYTLIYLKGWKEPFKWTIKLKDYLRTFYNKTTNKNEPMGQWATMPGVMLTKCCIVAAIRNIMPEDFSGCYTDDELGIDKTTVIDVTPDLLGDKKNENKMKQLCIAAKSNKIEIDSESLLSYAMKRLVETGKLKSESKKDIPMTEFEKVLGYVKSLVKKKEEDIQNQNQLKETVDNVKEAEKEQSKEAQNEKI